MKIQLTLLCSILLLGACNSERGHSNTDAGTEVDSSTANDAASADAATTDDATVPVDSGTPTDAGTIDFPEADYDESGCLTYESASAICAHAERALCDAAVECGFTDDSQCYIDCTMATVLCLGETQVNGCMAAIGGSCGGLTPCQGWLYFPSM